MDLAVILSTSRVVLPAIPQREEDLGVWTNRPLGRLRDMDIREGQPRGDARSGAHGTDGVVGFYGMAGRGIRTEGKFCD
jgi:hypothetical protein